MLARRCNGQGCLVGVQGSRVEEVGHGKGLDVVGESDVGHATWKSGLCLGVDQFRHQPLVLHGELS